MESRGGDSRDRELGGDKTAKGSGNRNRMQEGNQRPRKKGQGETPKLEKEAEGGMEWRDEAGIQIDKTGIRMELEMEKETERESNSWK